MDAPINDLQAKLEDMAKAVNSKHSSTVESLLQGTNLLLTLKVVDLLLPLKFKVPHIDICDKPKDLVYYIKIYRSHMLQQGTPDKIMCLPNHTEGICSMVVRELRTSYRNSRPSYNYPSYIPMNRFITLETPWWSTSRSHPIRLGIHLPSIPPILCR